MKLYEILSKYMEIKKEIKEYPSNGGLITAAILTHAWVCAKIFSSSYERVPGETRKEKSDENY